jgi:hypothetical protein
VVGISNVVDSAYAPGMYHDLVLRKSELVAQAVQTEMSWSETKAGNRHRREIVTFPRCERTRCTIGDSVLNHPPHLTQGVWVGWVKNLRGLGEVGDLGDQPVTTR